MKVDLRKLKPYEVMAQMVQIMIRVEHATTWETYTQNVVDHYLATIPADKREISFHTGRDAKRDMESNAQIIRRAVDDTSIDKLAELQDSLIYAMAEPYKSRCLQELLSRYDMLPVPMPGGGMIEDHESVAHLFEKVGKATTTLALMLEDGQIGPEDLHLKPTAIAELTDVQTTTQAIIERIFERVPDRKQDKISQIR